ncbi:ATP-binding protein [Tersicoccus sp. MR15.9]|uniref:ATP-binding protein n=1 Tax=Tersicoccus mangrovi TaxID=3121635 RepID=UPI002FE6458B
MARTRFVSTPFNRAFAAAVDAGVPVVLWGPPGEGKTAKLTGLLEAWGRHVETIIGATREPSDFLGVMVEEDDVISYRQFGWVKRLNAAPLSALFFDEFNTAGAAMKGMVRILEEGVVGETALHESVSIVAAANPVESSVDGEDLRSPVANRILHLDWVFDTAEWLENVGSGFEAVQYPTLDQLLVTNLDERRAQVAGSVTAFLRTRTHLLNPGPPADPVAAGLAWPSPRSWTKAINTLSRLHAEDVQAHALVIKGLVGEGAAAEYQTWLRAQDLIDPVAALADPSIVPWSDDRPDRLFALLNAVTSIVLNDPDQWKPAMKLMVACAEGGKPDFAGPFVTRLFPHRPEGAAKPRGFTPAFGGLVQRSTYRVAPEVVDTEAAAA